MKGNRKRSIFFKLLTIMLVGGFLVNLVVFVGFRRAFQQDVQTRSILAKNLNKYVNTLTAEVQAEGGQSTLAVAKSIGLAVRWEKREGPIVSEQGLPEVKVLKEHVWEHRHRDRMHALRHFPYPVGNYEGRFFTIIDTDRGDVVFYAPKKFDFEVREEILLFVLLLLSLVFAGVYFGIQKVLAPIRLLREGVADVAGGEFGRPVPVKGKGELAELTEQFNEMSAKIKSMMNDKQQLLYDVSHELRSPLTRMKVAMAMAEDHPYRNEIDADIGEMEVMISEILEVAQLTATPDLPLATVDIVPVIRELTDSYSGEPGIKLDLASSQLIRCHQDKTRIVLRNIIENALKYSKNQNLPIEIYSPGASTIAVRDHGEGIPEEQLQSVFEPFYRVDKSRQKSSGGYGLGLHLCQRIMLKQKGEIRLHSTLGQGTEVLLVFPESLQDGN